ncbi:MAG: exopolyphosphatase [Geobacteraceae bacterium]|nr:exopolyphosphatase [Geobacteraceae bacterium]
MNPLISSMDIGTNTARLLIGRLSSGIIERTHISRSITRLGGGFSRESGISREAADRTVEAIAGFATTLDNLGVKTYRAVATSAVRDAVNSDQFCSEILAKTGIKLEVISGDEEGVLTLSGVISGLDIVPSRSILFDVGGGSTEYTVAQGESIIFTKSLPLGVVRLTEGKGSVDRMEEKIKRELLQLKEEMRNQGVLTSLEGATLIGTAGTATTLAAISIALKDYDYTKVNNMTITRERIADILSTLIPLTPEKRLERVVGLEKGREDLIVAGTLLTLNTMDMLGFDQMKVSDFGLLEGVLLSI